MCLGWSAVALIVCESLTIALQGAVLGELDHGRGRKQQKGAGGPAEENDRGNREDERQREHAPTGLRVDRHREALCERRGRSECGQADQFAQTMACGGPFGPDTTYCDTLLTPTP